MSSTNSGPRKWPYEHGWLLSVNKDPRKSPPSQLGWILHWMLHMDTNDVIYAVLSNISIIHQWQSNKGSRCKPTSLQVIHETKYIYIYYQIIQNGTRRLNDDIFLKRYLLLNVHKWGTPEKLTYDSVSCKTWWCFPANRKRKNYKRLREVMQQKTDKVEFAICRFYLSNFQEALIWLIYRICHWLV